MVGRLLEVAGMGVVLLGLALGLTGTIDGRLELLYMGAGLIVFYGGYLLERRRT